MYRQAAFTGNTRLLKGNLHSHTTRSDGRDTPETVLRHYAKNGYDFFAVTDHRKYNYENFAPDAGLTIIPGMEMDRGLPRVAGHCFHTVVIGPAREDGNGFAQDQVFAPGTVKDAAEFQPLLDEMHKNNNLTFYCHPEWSCTPARAFEDQKGNFAMEIWNTGCALGDMDTNAAYWDELLVQGKRIWGVATDDGHCDVHYCGGWVRVNSENNVSAILTALKDGAFYSSCGPEISDFYVDGGGAHIECSPAKQIVFVNGILPHIARGAAAGETIARADVAVNPVYPYLRACVIDENGKRAWTNPIFFRCAR